MLEDLLYYYNYNNLDFVDRNNFDIMKVENYIHDNFGYY